MNDWKRLQKENPALRKHMLERAKRSLKYCEREIKKFDFEIGFGRACNEGTWAYFYLLCDRQALRLLINKLKKSGDKPK